MYIRRNRPGMYIGIDLGCMYTENRPGMYIRRNRPGMFIGIDLGCS